MSTPSPLSSPVVKLALVGIAAMGFYYLSTALEQGVSSIRQLPVEGTIFTENASASPRGAVALVPSSIHPLLVESQVKAGEAATISEVGAMVPMDKLFGRTEPAAGKTGAPGDAVFDFNAIAHRVTVQATMSNGAVINQVFYSRGEKVKSAAYVRELGGETKYPLLLAVNRGNVVLGDPDVKGSRLTVKLAP